MRRNDRYPRRHSAVIEWNEGDEAALEKLTPLVYGELRRIAGRCMAGERPGHTSQASALVNEAFLKLIDTRCVQCMHFFTLTIPTFQSLKSFGSRLRTV